MTAPFLWFHQTFLRFRQPFLWFYHVRCNDLVNFVILSHIIKILSAIFVILSDIIEILLSHSWGFHSHSYRLQPTVESLVFIGGMTARWIEQGVARADVGWSGSDVRHVIRAAMMGSVTNQSNHAWGWSLHCTCDRVLQCAHYSACSGRLVGPGDGPLVYHPRW
jgi:hypothetical protein